ncbi:RNA polymerase sigma factor [Pseudonocardia sp.]|uniref:RNA polymerase sigma factor n=1 Tax=Pseudonocardia sp. TaxID=60912 RepID=UPI003D113185
MQDDTQDITGGSRGELFRRHVVPHIPALLAGARALTAQPADAEDLVQDTLVRAYRSVDRFDGAHPRAWLMTIMRNAGANSHRAWRPDLLTDPGTDLDDIDEAAPTDSAESTVLGAEFDHTVRQAFRRLTAHQQAAVTLIDVEGLSHAQAARRLGIPEGTVMSRLHSARTRMRRLLAAAGTVPKQGDTL